MSVRLIRCLLSIVVAFALLFFILHQHVSKLTGSHSSFSSLSDLIILIDFNSETEQHHDNDIDDEPQTPWNLSRIVPK